MWDGQTKRCQRGIWRGGCAWSTSLNHMYPSILVSLQRGYYVNRLHFCYILHQSPRLVEAFSPQAAFESLRLHCWLNSRRIKRITQLNLSQGNKVTVWLELHSSPLTITGLHFLGNTLHGKNYFAHPFLFWQVRNVTDGGSDRQTGARHELRAGGHFSRGQHRDCRVLKHRSLNCSQGDNTVPVKATLLSAIKRKTTNWKKTPLINAEL